MHILVMSGEPRAAAVVQASFAEDSVRAVQQMGEAEALAERQRFDYAFVDVGILRALADPDDPLECLRALRRVLPGVQVVVLSHQQAVREAVSFVRGGASDYLSYPLLPEELLLTRENLERHEHVRSELSYLRGRAWRSEAAGPVTSRAEAMRPTLHKLRQVAPTRSTVLLSGETGTGKSYFAKVIHQLSSRAERPLVSVHCGAIPETLLESELFGHERGAFTGAERRKLGKFEIAQGGTLFLDEVATVSPTMQVKLLNVLQERTIQRLGGERDIDVDVRIIAATNQDLGRLSAEGSFRNDLYYRLNVFPIHIPPLRERREDIPELAHSFLTRLRGLYGKDILTLHPRVLEAFLAYAWPGNVRELENLLERAFILESTEQLTPESFPDELFTHETAPRLPVDTSVSLAAARQEAAEQAERLYLAGQLEVHRGRIDATAAAAAITPRQLHKLMLKHGLRKEDFKHRR